MTCSEAHRRRKSDCLKENGDCKLNELEYEQSKLTHLFSQQPSILFILRISGPQINIRHTQVHDIGCA